jgi:nucleoside-diphosphate kinase
MLKPEALMRSLVGEVISRIERKGLNIVGLRLVSLSHEDAGRLYKMHQDRPFYGPLIEHVTSGPVVAMVVEGPNAVVIVRGVVGATNPLEAQPGTIRGDLALITRKNIIHAADSLESARKEMSIFFSEDELVEYEKPTEKEFLL